MLFLDRQVCQMSAAGLLIFLSKIVTAKLVKAYSCVARVRIDEVGLAADDDHEWSDIEFSTLDQAWVLNVSLNHNILQLLNKNV